MIENKNKDFSIIGIYIHKDCKYKKVLNPGYYSLNDAYIYDEKNKKIEKNHNIKSLPDDFFGKNISISAIVGKNGSGKSSLLDMMYRIINNFAFCYINEEIHSLCKVKDIHADLCFVNEDNKYIISVNKEYCFIKFFSLEYPKGLIIKQKNVPKKINEIIKNFFYTIVINYSIHSLLPEDYEEESIPRGWINNIFNKNDGYQTPIVLNPYRYDDILHNEQDLTISRLQSILIKLNNEKEFIEGYKLDDIKYELDRLGIIRRYSYRVKDVLQFYKGTSYKTENLRFQNENDLPNLRECIEVFNMLLKDDKSPENNIIRILEKNISLENLKEYISEFLDHQDYMTFDEYKSSYILSCIYITYKVQKIKDLPVYRRKYKDKFYVLYDDVLINETEVKKIIKQEKQLDWYDDWKNLIKEIRGNHSHIEFKFHQTLNLFDFITKQIKKRCRNDKWSFSYKEKLENIKIKKKNLSEIYELLPSPVFKLSISLKKEGEEINFNTLSSGEKQLIFNNTTIVYHILNILSVKEKTSDMFSYRNINIILDEIELYFHPEYQRKYISNLVDVLNRLDLDKYKINIILSTHSPFILSDIPKQNILFLEEGNAISNKCKPTQTFAANISDLLKDSFFLADGFIGEFAAEKIGKIIKKIEGIGREKRKKRKNKEFSIEDCKKEITFIGEPLIRNKLFMMLDEMFLCDGEDYSKLYEECRKRDKNYKLEKLKREKKIIEKKIKELETNK